MLEFGNLGKNTCAAMDFFQTFFNFLTVMKKFCFEKVFKNSLNLLHNMSLYQDFKCIPLMLHVKPNFEAIIFSPPNFRRPWTHSRVTI